MDVKIKPLLGFVLSAVIGASYFFLVFPTSFPLGNTSYFNVTAEDVTQYLTGYWSYINSPWSFPLLYVPNINYPQGTLVTFLDAIPLMAFLLKILGPLAPTNPFGAWVFICFVLQSVGSWWAARQTSNNFVVPLLVSALLVQSPVLSMRLGHLSLMAHFLIIFSIGLYIKSRQNKSDYIIQWAILITIAFYINIYITGMCSVMLLASALDNGAIKPRRLVRFAIPYVPVILSAPIMMGFGVGDAGTDPGFGIYSMNVLSPIYGGAIFTFPHFTYPYAAQWEGYNYLGVGLAILLLFSFAYGQRKSGRILPILLVGVTIFALSNRIYFSDIELINWRLPVSLEPIVGIFRASGRFFWLVGYVLAFVAIWRINHLSSASVVAVLTAAVLIQSYDLRDLRVHVRALASRSDGVTINPEDWLPKLSRADALYLYPSFKCGHSSVGEVLPMQWLATKAGIKFNTGYIARYRPDCNAMPTPEDNKNAYVFVAQDFSLERAIELSPPNYLCESISLWHLCTPRRDSPS